MAAEEHTLALDDDVQIIRHDDCRIAKATWEMVISTLGFFPYLRPGAALFTAVAYQYQFAGPARKPEAVKQIYGATRGLKKNLFGLGADTVAERVFASGMTPLQVLEQHTLFGVYSRGLTATNASTWAAQIIRGEWGVWSRVLRESRRNAGFSWCHTDLRSCSKCVADDIEQFGFACWDVLHFIPSIHHCPKHGTPLVCELRGKGADVWEPMLPHGVGSDVSPVGPPPSDGYARYLRLWQQLFEGRLPIVALDAWTDLIERVVSTFGSTEVACKRICRSVENDWGIGSGELAERIGSQVASDFVRTEIEHKGTPARIAQKLIMITAFERLGVPIDESPSQTSLPLVGHCGSDAPLCTRLRAELLHAGFPSAVTKGLCADGASRPMAHTAGVGRIMIRRAISSISTGLLERLLQAPEWAAKGWVTSELQRRGVVPVATGNSWEQSRNIARVSPRKSD